MRFTYEYLKHQLEQVKDCGYRFMTLQEYYRAPIPQRIAIVRVDVDMSVRKCEPVMDIFDNIGVRASWFFRLHGPYNLFGFENYRILRNIIRQGHEVGVHTELIDQCGIWEEDVHGSLKRDLSIFYHMTGVAPFGVAAHGDISGNIDIPLWQNMSPSDFGLIYQAHDLMRRSIYVSDSLWHKWKVYDHNVLIDGDERSPAEHARETSPEILYILTHSDTWYERHIYEDISRH